MYTATLTIDVKTKTPNLEIFLTESDGIVKIQIAVMTNKLNDADPTIVDGPNSPGVSPRVTVVS